MKIIMVLDLSAIAIVDLSKELIELALINNTGQLVELNVVGGQQVKDFFSFKMF